MDHSRGDGKLDHTQSVDCENRWNAVARQTDNLALR